MCTALELALAYSAILVLSIAVGAMYVVLGLVKLSETLLPNAGKLSHAGLPDTFIYRFRATVFSTHLSFSSSRTVLATAFWNITTG